MSLETAAEGAGLRQRDHLLARLRDWQEAGVWEKLHTKLLNWLGDEAAIDWSRASVDSLSVRAKRGASKRGQTRPTAASPAPSTTSWWIATASHSASASPRPTSTIPPNSCRWSMPSRRSSDREDDPAGRASVLPSCTRTKRMTPSTCGGRYVFAASPLGSPGAGSTPASGWDGTGGWWSARSPGCWAVAVSSVRYERRGDLLQGLLHLACALICVRFLAPACP